MKGIFPMNPKTESTREETRKLSFEAILPKLDRTVIFWTCGACGGGNPMSSAYCQWCGN
jgi:hypothetical protein